MIFQFLKIFLHNCKYDSFRQQNKKVPQLTGYAEKVNIFTGKAWCSCMSINNFKNEIKKHYDM